MRDHRSIPILPRSRPQAGFTLIEVMIVVAILGILAAVAIPAYGDYVRRGRLPEAFTQLSSYRVVMEQYYQDNRNYGPAANNCANGRITLNPPGLNYFSFSCTVSGTNSDSYTLTATSTRLLGSTHVYTVNESGTKTTTTFKGVTQNGKNCWLVRGSEC